MKAISYKPYEFKVFEETEVPDRIRKIEDFSTKDFTERLTNLSVSAHGSYEFKVIAQSLRKYSQYLEGPLAEGMLKIYYLHFVDKDYVSQARIRFCTNHPSNIHKIFKTKDYIKVSMIPLAEVLSLDNFFKVFNNEIDGSNIIESEMIDYGRGIEHNLYYEDWSSKKIRPIPFHELIWKEMDKIGLNGCSVFKYQLEHMYEIIDGKGEYWYNINFSFETRKPSGRLTYLHTIYAGVIDTRYFTITFEERGSYHDKVY